MAIGRLLPGNRNDCLAWAETGAAEQVAGHTVITDGRYQGFGPLIPH